MYRKTQSSYANASCADDMPFFSPMRRYALFLLAAFLAPALPAGVAQDGPFGTRYDYAFGADGCFRTAHGTSAREPVAPVPERWRGYFSGGFGVVPSGLQHLVVTNGGIRAGAAKSILFNGVLSVVNCAVFFVIGVALWTFFSSHPEQLGAVIEKNDAVFPVFIANSLPTGFSGLVLAAVAASTMSTLSANLNSAASAVTTDFYARLVPGATERGKFRCGIVSTVATGLLGGAFALVLANAQILSIYDEFQRFLGILTAGLGSLFFMGVFMKRVNGAGALAGLLANYAVTIGLDRVAFPGKPHLLLYGTLGMVVSLIVAPIVSAAVGAKGKEKGENVGS